MSTAQIFMHAARSAMLPSTRAYLYARRRVLANTAKWWAIAVMLSLGFGAVRASADDAGMPVHGARLEETFFGGLPSLWIQEHVYSLWPGGLSWAFTAIHCSWFLTPFVALPLVMVFRNNRLGSLIRWWLGLLVISHLAFILFPMEPPWMADHSVIRVVATRAGSVQDHNVVAAMPSLHVALPLLFGLWFARERWRAPAIGFLVYSSLVAVEVVSSGEHYVVDVVGAGFAAGAVVLVATHGRQFTSTALKARPRLTLAPAFKSEGGQALIEFAFIFPILMVLLLSLLDFGIALDRRDVLQHAVREGARHAAVGNTDVEQYTADQSQDLLTPADVSVCYQSVGPIAAGEVGSSVRVNETYSYDFNVGGEILSAFGVGAPAIGLSTHADARLEKKVTGAPACS